MLCIHCTVYNVCVHFILLYFIYFVCIIHSLTALTLLVGQQEGHPPVKTWCSSPMRFSFGDSINKQ